MNKKKKLSISILLILLIAIIACGITYAFFVFVTNSGITEANSGKLDIAYNIENSNINGLLIPSSTRSGGISTSVTAKLNSGSIPGNINLYITPTFLTGMPSSALMWEVDVVDTSDNLLTHYEGDFTGCVINTPVKITDAYGLTSNLLTFKIYIWLNGERIDNTNFNSDNGFTATISADSMPITGEFDPTYTVTFDADGGIGASGTKSVRVGEDYGLLPTPTRPGYTFLGWNGKNKFNPEKAVADSNSSEVYITEDNEWIRFITGNDSMGRFNYYINGNENTQYIFSVITKSETSASNLIKFIASYSDNHHQDLFYISTTDTMEHLLNGATLENKTLKCIHSSYTNNKKAYIKIEGTQLEEGDTATTYEPYYVTSDVNVTQAKNHTLKAIWEANS